MQETIRKMMMFGVGLAAMTRDKIEELVNELVKKGEMSEKEGREFVNDLMEKSRKVTRDLEAKTEEMVAATLKKLNIPTRRELDDLRERVDRLEKREG